MTNSTKQIPPLTEKNMERFWRRVKKGGDDECWNWVGSCHDNGYGVVILRNTIYSAHRVSFVLHGGSFTDEKPYALHSCDNKRCVNPRHIRAGSPMDNTSDAMSRNRLAAGDRHPSKLHPDALQRGEKHHHAKVTEGDVITIRILALSGVSQRKIAARFKIHQTAVSLIVTRKVWRHVA